MVDYKSKPHYNYIVPALLGHQAFETSKEAVNKDY